MLLLDGVSITVGGTVGGRVGGTVGRDVAVEDLSLEVGDREVVGLIGPSGAGKSTVLDAVTGLYRPCAGRIVFQLPAERGDQEPRDLTRLAPHRIASLGVARTFQRSALFPGLSVRDNVDLGRKVKVRSSVLAAARCWRSAQREDARQRLMVEQLLSFLGLADVSDTPTGALPCGLRKRVELGRALAVEPDLVLVDDITSGMTIGEKDEMVRHLRRVNEELGIALLFASHDIGVTTELCGRVIALHQGRKIAEGPAELIRQDHRVMSAYLGADLVRD